MSKCSLHLRKSRQASSASVKAFTGTTLETEWVDALDVAWDPALDVSLDVAEFLSSAEVVLGVACP